MARLAGQKTRASDYGQLSSTAQYQASGAQSVNDSTATVVAFGTANITSSLITRSTEGAGHKFTFAASGILTVTITVQFAANATGERRINLEDSLGLWHCSTIDHGDGVHASIQSLAFTKFVVAGDYVLAKAFQTSGGALNLDANSLTALGRIDLCFLTVET